MLTRRQIRIKVMQALYAYSNAEIGIVESLRNLEKSLKQIYPLFLLELKAMSILHRFEEERLERGKTKRIPSPEDLNPNMAFVNNSILSSIRHDEELQEVFKANGIRWGEDKEVLRSIYKEIIAGDCYKDYIAKDVHDEDADITFILDLYQEHIMENDLLHQIYEDRNMHWADDLESAQMLLVKCLRNISERPGKTVKLPDLYKDGEDEDFARELFRKVAQNNSYFDELITLKTKNWESDRIAMLDKLLMKMSLAELIYFNSIPVKVTLNEYIELSKLFSTPKSSVFINGVLDKLVEQLTEEKQIHKIGKGLV